MPNLFQKAANLRNGLKGFEGSDIFPPNTHMFIEDYESSVTTNIVFAVVTHDGESEPNTTSIFTLPTATNITRRHPRKKPPTVACVRYTNEELFNVEEAKKEASKRR
ncbi:hypothetical protein WA026_008310 [Henosepilachna vigintioctopunctata]|uniref:Uncharacterized protein n=1 Tax=Henosepilachna vigintioctopunctata TaxID=420089 RepID=A0AAW1TL60_9CUCU